MRLILISLFLWASSLSAQKIQDTLRLPAIHTVEKGETLFKISQKYSMNMSELRELNPGVDILQPGMKLKVKGKWLINPQTTPVYEGRNVILHEIKKGETLYGLSKQYNTSIEDLKKINGVQEFNLQPGNYLKVLGTAVSEATQNVTDQVKPIDASKVKIDTSAKINPAPAPVPVTAPVTAPVKEKEDRKGGIIEAGSAAKKGKYNLSKEKITVWNVSSEEGNNTERASIWMEGVAKNQVVAIVNPDNNTVVYAINQGKPKSNKSPKSAVISSYLAEKLGFGNSKMASVYVQYAIPEKL
ncbi:MAG: LysM peptidoglycan-binding domain-containing protein [Bacteroidia bacterium]|nr:LysM peptidoglycan-binding domain-containing protein [Bacteroidia bacterium]